MTQRGGPDREPSPGFPYVTPESAYVLYLEYINSLESGLVAAIPEPLIDTVISGGHRNSVGEFL